MFVGADLFFAMGMPYGEDLGAFGRPRHVNGAGEAGVKGMDDAQDLDRLVDIPGKFCGISKWVISPSPCF